MQLVLESDESPLPSGKISVDEVSWISSLICIGGLIGNVFWGFITNRFGRKRPLITLTAPTIVRHNELNLQKGMIEGGQIISD